MWQVASVDGHRAGFDRKGVSECDGGNPVPGAWEVPRNHRVCPEIAAPAWLLSRVSLAAQDLPQECHIVGGLLAVVYVF